MTADHGGLAAELARLERAMYRVLATLNDPRKVRDYLARLRGASLSWLEENPSGELRR